MRHGESEANARRVFAGQLDSPLTEAGRQQAETVADLLSAQRVDRVVSSDLSRARDTAAAIARRHSLEVECLPELREIDVGEMAGRSWTEVHETFQRADTEGFVQWPGGESLEAILQRALPAVSRIARESPGKTVVIVGHGGVTRILVSHFLGLLPRLERTRASNTNITKVASDGETFRVVQLFDEAHLPPPSPEAQATATE